MKQTPEQEETNGPALIFVELVKQGEEDPFQKAMGLQALLGFLLALEGPQAGRGPQPQAGCSV